MKRGQITIFIVVSLVLLFVILGTYFAFSYFSKQRVKMEQEKAEQMITALAPIQLFVEDCLKKSAIDGMYEVFSKGGYYAFPPALEIWKFAEEEKTFQVPYYFQQKKAQLPSLEQIEKETAKATESFFYSCTGDFGIFQKQGYIIKSGEAKAEIRFTEKQTLVDLDFPLAIKLGEQETAFEKFSSVIPFDFTKKYSIIKNYLADQEKEPDYFLVGELSSLAYENGYDFGFKQFGDTGAVVLIDFNYNESLKKEPLVYSFVLSFDWPKLKKEISIPLPSLQLKRLETWNITEPGIATYQVKAMGEELRFYADPDSLKIDPESGLITLNTNEFPNDEYLYYIKVVDKYGQRTVGPLLINVNVNTGQLPIIKPIGRQIASVGKEFYYQVKAENPIGGLLFTTDSYLFDINKKTGGINFTPAEEDKGIHSVRVDVANIYGRTWERWELEIK